MATSMAETRLSLLPLGMPNILRMKSAIFPHPFDVVAALGLAALGILGPVNVRIVPLAGGVVLASGQVGFGYLLLMLAIRIGDQYVFRSRTRAVLSVGVAGSFRFRTRSPRAQIFQNRMKRGQRAPPGTRGGPAADQRRRFRPEGPRTAWPASWIGGFWTRPRLARSRPPTDGRVSRAQPATAGRALPSVLEPGRRSRMASESAQRSAATTTASGSAGPSRLRPPAASAPPRRHNRRTCIFMQPRAGVPTGRGPSLLTGCMESILIVFKPTYLS